MKLLTRRIHNKRINFFGRHILGQSLKLLQRFLKHCIKIFRRWHLKKMAKFVEHGRRFFSQLSCHFFELLQFRFTHIPFRNISDVIFNLKIINKRKKIYCISQYLFYGSNQIWVLLEGESFNGCVHQFV